MQIQLFYIRLIMSNSHIIFSKRGDDLSKITLFVGVLLFCQGPVLILLNIVLLWRSIIFPFQMWCLLVETQYHYVVDLPV
jgi:hypothetical protein